MTIVAQGRACLFGEVAGEQLRLNEREAWCRRSGRGCPNGFRVLRWVLL